MGSGVYHRPSQQRSQEINAMQAVTLGQTNRLIDATRFPIVYDPHFTPLVDSKPFCKEDVREVWV